MDAEEAQVQLLNAAEKAQGHDIVDKDWSGTLCAAPGILNIMGESMILASVPCAAQVRFPLPNTPCSASALVETTLASALYECNQLGQDAFVTAHTGMDTLSMRSRVILPVIDQLVKLLAASSSPLVEKLFQGQLTKLTSCADTCKKASGKIHDEFTAWNVYTKQIQAAIVGKHSEVVVSSTKQKERITEQKHTVEKAVQKEEHARIRLNKRVKELEDAQAAHRAAEASAQQAAMVGVELSFGAPVLGVAVLSCTAAYVFNAASKVKQAQERAKERHQAIEEAEASRVRLVQEMKVLQDKETDLATLTAVLAKGLERLQQLQANITLLLIFFNSISEHVKILAGNILDDGGFISKMALKDASTQESDLDLLMQVVKEDALNIKAEFVAMQYISQAYSQVSLKHIMPGFEIIGRMALAEPSLSDGQVSAKHIELSRYTSNATESIRSVVSEKQEALQQNMLTILQQAAVPIFGDAVKLPAMGRAVA
ncbi:hypothetical protein KCU78_g2578, partial [Aureobasidium melanogenum]